MTKFPFLSRLIADALHGNLPSEKLQGNQHIWAPEWMFDAILSPVTGSDPVLGRLSARKEFDLDLSRWEWIERSDIKEAIG